MDILVLILILIVWLIWSYINRTTLNDFMSPFNLLFYFWVLPLLLSFLNWSDLQKGLSLESSGILLVCTLILICISVIPMQGFRKTRLPTGLAQIHGLTHSPIIKYEILVLYFIALIAMYFAEFRNGLPILEYLTAKADDSALHLVGKDSKLQTIAQGLMVAGALCFYTGMNATSKMRRLFYFSLAMIVPLLGVLKASKSGVFTPALYYAAIYYYLKVARGQRLFSTRTLFVLLGGFILMTSITMIRTQGVRDPFGFATEIKFRYTDTLPFPVNQLVATIYGYTALNYQNFSNYVDHDEGTLRLGTSFFHPFFSMLMQGDVVKEKIVPKSQRYFVSTAATVGTYLRDLYMEGGVFICIFGSVVYASLINWLYVKFRRVRGGQWFFVYVIMLFPWVWIFFQNAFSILIFYTNAFYVLAIFTLPKVIRIAMSKASNLSTNNLIV